MKAKVKKTGEIVEVLSFVAPLGTGRTSDDNVSYIDSKGNVVHNAKLNYYWDFVDITELQNVGKNKTDIDWEQRRYEIAKASMQGILSNEAAAKFACSNNKENRSTPVAVSQFAVACADALIAELKKGGAK